MVVWGDITKFTVSAVDSGERWQTSCFTSGTILHIKCLCCNTQPCSLKLADTHTHTQAHTNESLHMQSCMSTSTFTHAHTHARMRAQGVLHIAKLKFDITTSPKRKWHLEWHCSRLWSAGSEFTNFWQLAYTLPFPQKHCSHSLLKHEEILS